MNIDNIALQLYNLIDIAITVITVYKCINIIGYTLKFI